MEINGIISLLTIIIILLVIDLWNRASIETPRMLDVNTTRLVYTRSCIYHVLQSIDVVFTKNDIWYVIAFGTLLGAVRHSDIIPWDDDGDILVQRTQVSTILNLRNEFAAYDIEIVETWKLVQFSYQGHIIVDAFIIDNTNNVVARCFDPWDRPCIYANPPSTRWWAKYFDFPFSWLTRLYRYKFGHLELWGPFNAQLLLEFWYGNQYLTKCMSQEYDHQTLSYVKSHALECGSLPHPQFPTG